MGVGLQIVFLDIAAHLILEMRDFPSGCGKPTVDLNDHAVGMKEMGVIGGTLRHKDREMGVRSFESQSHQLPEEFRVRERFETTALV